MKKSIFALRLTSLILLAGYAFGIQDPGTDPNNGSGWQTNPADINTIQTRNAASGPGNPTNTYYWFAASKTDQGSPIANGSLTQVTPGVVQLGNTAAQSFSGVNTELITAGTVSGLLASTQYYIYAQACPFGVSANTSGQCSNWIRIATAHPQTDDLPPNVFSTPVPADVTAANVLTIHSSVPDPQNVSVYQLQIQNLDAGTGPSTISPPPVYPKTPTQTTTVGPSGAISTFAFLPNTKYQYIGQVVYPWSQLAPPSAQNEIFYTTPLDPQTPASVVGHTRFTVTVNFTTNAGNHTGTVYRVFIHSGNGLGGSVVTQSGNYVDNSPGSLSSNIQIPGLTPDPVNPLTFTAGVIAVNEGNVPTNNNWRNSAEILIGTFVVQPFAVTITFPTINTTNATAHLQVNDGAGINHFMVVQNGNTQSETAWTGGSGVNASQDYPLNSLAPNTAYSIRAKLCESPSGDQSQCSGNLPATAATFTTDVADPTSFNMTSSDPFSLDASWSDTLNPGTNTRYTVRYCTNSAMTTGCVTSAQTASHSINLTASPNTSYWAQVTGISTIGGSPSNAIPSTPFGPVMTNANGASMQIVGPTTLVFGNPQLYTANVTDTNGNPIASPSNLVWTVTPGAGNATPATTTGAQATLTGSALGDFTLKLHNPDPAYADRTITVSVIPSGIQFQGTPTITLIPRAAGVVSANLHCSAIDNSPGASSSLKYTWQKERGPDPIADITPQGPSTSGDATVTFGVAAPDATNPYQFRCIVTDDVSGSNFSLTNSTNVAQVVSKIDVTPNNIPLRTLQNQVFTAAVTDQFSKSMPTPSNLQWDTTGGGSVSGSGAQVNFVSGTIGQQVSITATDPVTTVKGVAVVNLFSFDVSGAYAYPVPYKANSGTGVIHFVGLGTQSTLHIYTTSGRRVLDKSLTSPTYDWDIKNSSSESIASGVYFYLIESPEGKKNGKLIIIQ